MKGRKLFIVLGFVLASSTAFCQSSGRSIIREDSLKSKVLNVTRKYTVYLPGGYEQSRDKKYPVLYLLHGHSHRNNCFVEDGNLQEIADKLIKNGSSAEMIIVTPDANRVKNGYFDTKDWSYETFFFEEFIPYIETKYRISGIKSSRAVAGFSMGGGGAVVYAIKHPDMFSSVYAMSSLMSLPKPKERPAAMNPNPQSMEFGQSVLANDCIALIENIDQTRLEKLRKIKWFVDCGDDDFLLDVNTKFCRAMKEAKVPFELRIRDGDHNFEYWTSALYLALPFVSDGFKGK